ncbi:hypothetical protein ACLKA6_007577 [Drosophila palustris]
MLLCVTNCLFPLGRAGWLIAANILNFTTLSRQTTISTAETTKRIPVPDPGVPALPEMTTSPSSPSISRASFHQQVYMYHRINATHKIKTTRRQRRNTGYEYDNFMSDQVLQDAPVAAGTPRENQ